MYSLNRPNCPFCLCSFSSYLKPSCKIVFISTSNDLMWCTQVMYAVCRFFVGLLNNTSPGLPFYLYQCTLPPTLSLPYIKQKVWAILVSNAFHSQSTFQSRPEPIHSSNVPVLPCQEFPSPTLPSLHTASSLPCEKKKQFCVIPLCKSEPVTWLN